MTLALHILNRFASASLRLLPSAAANNNNNNNAVLYDQVNGEFIIMYTSVSQNGSFATTKYVATNEFRNVQ
jgi:hypothetical protein